MLPRLLSLELELLDDGLLELLLDEGLLLLLLDDGKLVLILLVALLTVAGLTTS